MKAAKLLLPAVLLAVSAAPLGVARAQSSSSASFEVTGQTLNSGLGKSTSPSFIADACLGIEPAVSGASSSASFNVLAGCIAALQQSACGNGMLEVNEECDDGNTADGDCCSAACLFETTECRPAAGECDAAETCTGSSFPCPADGLDPAGTPCTADANPCTLDQCDGASSACMHVPDNDNPICQPMFTGDDPEPGDTTVNGRGNPGCIGGTITVFDCGPEVPPICFNGNDPVLGMGVKNPDGTFMITVPPLEFGQVIYIQDSCTTPPLTSNPFLVVGAAPAPLLSPWAMALAVLLLIGTGAIGVLRLRGLKTE
jgi:cysteine-rich repeat protein